MAPSISQADSRLTHDRTATANSQKVFYREAGYFSAPALFAKDTVQSFSFRATEKVNVAASPLIEDISNADTLSCQGATSRVHKIKVSAQ